MQRTLALVTALLLLTSSAARAGEVVRSTRPMWGKHATQYHCPLRSREVTFCVLRQTEGGAFDSSFLQPGVGRWQRFIWGFRPGVKAGPPTHVEVREAADGATMAVIETPLRKDDGEIGVFRVQAVQVPDLPAYVFYRLAAEGGEALLASFYLGVAAPAYNKRFSTLHLAWPGHTANLGDPLPWSGTLPPFSALAWFSRGGGRERQADFLVIDPACLKTLREVRWRKGDDRAVLNLVPAGKALLFALGAVEEENAETAALPRFFERESGEVLARLGAIDWNPAVDREALRAALEEVAGLVAAADDEALRKELAQLKTALDAAAEKEEAMDESAWKRRIETLKKKALDAGLEHLLETE